MRAIEAVVFDVGRVLIEWDLRHLFARLIPDAAELDWFLSHVVTEEWHYQADAGRPLAVMLAERKAAFPHHAVLIDAYATRFNETIPGPVPGALEILADLDTAGVALYAITNFGAEFWAGFAPTMPDFARFRAIVVSGQEMLAKPDPAIFRLAAARFGHEPQAMLFIDDNPRNIDAAAALGWRTHLFSTAAELRRRLSAEGLFCAPMKPVALRNVITP